ncbi:MAG: A/G-specific adenine glycosylase [Oscillospiraceae bacterium]|nr:A/G-specific adenine glycosylase [Oscillospiraceae bacterium]
MNENLNQLPGALLPWYEANKRSLPWRQDKDPYHIWLSEIMLQQTRVEAVKGYYHRFLTAVPTIADLAQADEELLLKLWEGLGYYSRVRNLKKAAQVILTNYGGKFPQDHKDVLALPGIGDYTAGAICSIAFGQKQPAVDGNVLRVMARLQADATPIDQPARKKEVQALLADVYPENAGDFTQALMELGATVCGPNRGPDCENCPCNSFCQGYQQGIAAKLPVKTAKKARRIEEKTVLILRCDGQYALVKRPDNGLLAGLWQFPERMGILELPQVIAALGIPVKEVYRQVERKHIFTHIEWKMRGIYLEIAERTDDFQWFTAQEVACDAALPTAYRQFWDDRGDF